MLKKLLIANRGEIACRIIRSAKGLGIDTVAIYSDIDKDALHVQMADESICLGGASALENYLDMDAIIAAIGDSGADAVHPGYGFLSENAKFADRVAEIGVKFVGPSGSVIQMMGSKIDAKNLIVKTGIPVVPGYSGENQDHAFLQAEADKIGYPLMIKASAGGGGRGMRVVESAENFNSQLESAQHESRQAFGDDKVLLEKFLAHARHIEVQVLADQFGNVVHLYERDCSMQRRHQKVIEEAPAPDISEEFRQQLCHAAVEITRSTKYEGAGTIEFICEDSAFYFMEMNTRLQVEHPVTEAITGVDIVDWQLRIAAGEKLGFTQPEVSITGHAVEARLYAENPKKNFMPSAGKLICLDIPEGVRMDTGVFCGSQVSIYYDPMIAKLTAHSRDRLSAFHELSDALEHTCIAGVEHNLGFLVNLLRHPRLLAGACDTDFIGSEISDLIPQLYPNDIVLALVWHLLNNANDTPWQEKNAFRLNLPAVHKFRVAADGKRFSVQVIRDRLDKRCFEVELDGESISVRGARCLSNRAEAWVADKKCAARIVADENAVFVMRGGNTQQIRFL